MLPQFKPLESVLIKPAGPDCNMDCTYCFYLDRADLFPESKKHRMSGEVLEATIRQVMTQGAENVSLCWQGGEPTLMGVDFFQQAVEFEKQYGRNGQVVANAFQTNGLLINEVWCRLFRDYNFLIGLSLDGPQHVHDRYRIFKGGQPTWARVSDSLKLMLDQGVDVNALVVLNEYSARFPREIYDYLKQSGVKHMQFIPCMEPHPDDRTQAAPFSVSPEQFGAFLCEIFDCWTADFYRGEPTVFVRWFESVFATYVGVRPPECTLLEECGEYVVVEHNGDVFSCDFFVENRWRLGNVLDGEITTMLNSEKQSRFGLQKSDLPEACQSCRWLEHCRGGCPKERWQSPSGAEPSYLCEGYKMFFSHADQRLRKLADRWLRERRQEAVRRPTAPAEAPAGQIGRNDPCPCGSGEKHKRCCGQ